MDLRQSSRAWMLQAARWLAFASSVAIVIGIAPSQILLGMALAALFLSGEKLRLPPIKLPLGLFLLGTLIAIAFSGNPAAGWPQVKKIYVFFQLLIVFSLLRDMAIIRWLFDSGRADLQFLAAHSRNWERLRERSQVWTLERAADVAGVGGPGC